MEVCKLIERKSYTTCWAPGERFEGSNYGKQLRISPCRALTNKCTDWRPDIFTTRFCTCGLWVETRLTLYVAVPLQCLTKTQTICVRCGILTALTTTIMMLLDEKPFSLVDWYQRFGGICCFFLQYIKWR
jgi:hypothetical protein